MGAAVTSDEIDAIAEAVAAKIGQAILRMPDDIREIVKTSGAGWYSTPGTLVPGPNAPYLQAFTRPGGIELQLKRPDGSLAWQAVII